MSGGSDFERDLINTLNENSDNRYKATRFKQHRFSSQLCDVIVLSDQPQYYKAIECKSLKADQDNLKDEKKGSAGKLYFTQHFSTNDDGKHQLDRMKQFIDKSHMKGVIAVSIKRGPGKRRLYYALDFQEVYEKYKADQSGITFDYMKENGVELLNRKQNGLVKNYQLDKILQI